MSGKTQVLCLGCNAALFVELSDDSNVVHCDHCGTLSVIQPGMAPVSSSEAVDAEPFSIDDLLEQAAAADEQPAHMHAADVQPEDEQDDASFELAPDVRTQAASPTATTPGPQSALTTSTSPSTSPSPSPSPSPDAPSHANENGELRQDARSTPAHSSRMPPQVTQPMESREKETSAGSTPTAPVVRQDESLTTIPSAETNRSHAGETTPVLNESESPVLPEPTVLDGDSLTDPPTGDSESVESAESDAVITGDLMFFFESLEDAPDDAPASAADSVRPSGAALTGTQPVSRTAHERQPTESSEAATVSEATTVAEMGTLAKGDVAGEVRPDRSTDLAPADSQDGKAVTAPAVLPTSTVTTHPLSGLFEMLKEETSTIQHMAEDEVDFRSALKTYFDSLPNHNLSRLAAKATISRIADVQCGKLTLNLFHEKRSLVKRTVAYKGWAIPDRRRDETNTKAWDISWKPPKEPSSSEETKIVADSQELNGCTRCQQTGQSPCKKCRGKGRFGCAACTATGLMPCHTCSGTGQKSRARQIRGTRRCTTCGGSGSQQYIPAEDSAGGPKTRTCPKCTGSGRESFVESENYSVPCDTCHADGKVACQVCRGKKVTACRDCSGRGARECRACLGNRILVTYLEVRRTFQVESVSTDIVGQYAADLFAKSFQQPFHAGHHQQQNWRGADPVALAGVISQIPAVPGGLASMAHDFLDECFRSSLDASKNPGRTTAWQVDLDQYSTRSVIYSLGKRRYRTIWDTGLGEAAPTGSTLPHVFPHRSVITNWCLTQLQELRQNAEATGVRDAALQYQRLQAIAEVDPACREAIAEQESKKDETLQQIVSASRKVKASRAQLIMFSTAGIILAAAGPVYYWLNDLIPVVGCVVAAAVVALIGWKVVGGD